jgi:hypothetical protein
VRLAQFAATKAADAAVVAWLDPAPPEQHLCVFAIRSDSKVAAGVTSLSDTRLP